MVPMHAQKRMEALHEPERGAPAPPGPAWQENVDRAGLEPRAPIPRCVVPVPAQKRMQVPHNPARTEFNRPDFTSIETKLSSSLPRRPLRDLCTDAVFEFLHRDRVAIGPARELRCLRP